jgi:long-subunit acyl-CoA synthetase (AMP-forming)
VAWHEGARIIRQALASTPGTRVRLEPLGHQTRRRNDVQVITIVGSQAKEIWSIFVPQEREVRGDSVRDTVGGSWWS